MRSIHWTTCLAVAGALFVTGPTASAAEQIVVSGHSCGFDVAEVSPGGVYSGTVFGGPMFASTPRRPVTGVYLLCTIQVNAPEHAGPDTSVTTAWGMGSASVAPTPFTFEAAWGDVVAVCTEIWIDTGDGHISGGLDSNGVFVEFGDDNPHCSEQINIGPDDIAGCNVVYTAGICVNITRGVVLISRTIFNIVPIITTTHTVDGWLDAYRFSLATGSSVVLPCVSLKANSATANPCATAGGTFVSRTATLVSQPVNQPGVTPGLPLTTVRVCEAHYTVTVAGFGAKDFPAPALC